MKETGQILKDRRESQDISLAEVSISTKITSRMLQAIESGDMDHLPARTFLRGFVKSYATFLKMDVDEVLRAFNEEMAIMDAPPAPPEVIPPEGVTTPDSTPAPEPVKVKEEAKPLNEPLIPEGISNSKKLGLAGGLLALVLLISFVYRMVDKYETEAKVEAPPQLSKIEADASDTDKEEKVEAATPPAPENSEKKVETAAVAEESAPAETKATSDTKEPAKEAAPAPAPEKKPAEAVAPEKRETVATAPKVDEPKKAEPKAEAKPTETAAATASETKPTVKPSGTQEIIIEALDKVEVRFRVNSGESKTITLQPDQVHTIKAAGTIALEISDGGAVNLIHNGKDVGVPGDLGKPKKLQLQ